MNLFRAVDGFLLARVFAPLALLAAGRATPLSLAGFAAEAAAAFWIGRVASLHAAAGSGGGGLALDMAVAGAFAFSMAMRRRFLVRLDGMRSMRPDACGDAAGEVGPGMLPRLGTALGAVLSCAAAAALGGSPPVAMQAGVFAAMCASFYFEACAPRPAGRGGNGPSRVR